MLELKLQLFNESLRTFPHMKLSKDFSITIMPLFCYLKYEKNHSMMMMLVVNEKQSYTDVRDAAQLNYNRKYKLKKNTIKKSNFNVTMHNSHNRFIHHNHHIIIIIIVM